MPPLVLGLSASSVADDRHRQKPDVMPAMPPEVTDLQKAQSCAAFTGDSDDLVRADPGWCPTVRFWTDSVAGRTADRADRVSWQGIAVPGYVKQAGGAR